MSAPDFDWANDECVVLHKQPAIAVYPNNMGTIAIRQQRDWDEDEDTIIVTASLEGAEAIAQAILREVEAVRQDLGHAPRELPKDPTATDRQRRRRNKQRSNGGTEWPDHSTQDTPAAELNGVLFGPEGPDHSASDRDVTRDSHAVTLFERRDAPVTSPAVVA
jgi:hypothetical protein